MKIGFIGLGKLGLPCAEVIAKKGFNVVGYDVVEINSDIIEQKSSIKETVIDRDIVFIAVPTPHHKDYDGSYPTSHLKHKDFDYEIVKKCVVEADKHMNNKQLLVLISTVLPGTTSKIIMPLVKNVKFLYNPYLIAMGTVAWDMVNPEMIMIGTKDGNENGDAKELKNFYGKIMENNPRIEIGTWDECECIKIFYNTFISAKISLVNMIQDVAEKIGNINVDVVTGALANSNQRIMGPKYMTAGMGDGGACHPRDNIALRHLASRLGLGYDLFESIMSSREKQAENIADLLVKYAKAKNFEIYIHGKAYKPKIKYCDGSYSLLIGHYCEKLGYKPRYIDPLTGDKVEKAKGVILLAHNQAVTYPETSKLDQTNPNLYCEIQDGSVIIDPWRTFETNNKNIEVVHYGNTRSK
jgi:UDPglucose 6-dehydrogenase